MSENKHQMMLRDLRRIDTATIGLVSTISMADSSGETKRQADIITNYLNQAALHIWEVAQRDGIIWDGILLGAVQFFNGVVSMAEKDLKTSMVRGNIQLDTAEVIH